MISTMIRDLESSVIEDHSLHSTFPLYLVINNLSFFWRGNYYKKLYGSLNFTTCKYIFHLFHKISNLDRLSIAK